ncbi:MAG TPA: rhodanese-like domain-containing protein [Myxococcales bacterium]
MNLHFEPTYILYALAALFFAWTIFKRRGDISSAEARKLVSEGGARLLDVRTPGEFASGHLDGALNIPVQDLSASLKKVGPKEKPVVVYCASGARSAMAARLLKANGWQTVRNLGSMSRW